MTKITIDENTFNELTISAEERNAEVHDSIMLSRKNYFLQVVHGADVSHQSVLLSSNIGLTIEDNPLETPYMMLISLSTAYGIRILAMHKFLTELCGGNRMEILHRLAVIYEAERTSDYPSEEAKMAWTLDFSLEALFISDLDVTEGSDILEGMSSSNDKLQFLYWVGDRLPTANMSDEISSKAIFPSSDGNSFATDDQKIAISSLEEKCKQVIYPSYYSSNLTNVVRPSLLIPNPSKDADSAIERNYANKIEREELEAVTVPSFRSAALAFEHEDEESGETIKPFASNGTLVDVLFNGTTNVLLFTDGKSLIDQKLVENSNDLHVTLPNFDVRVGLVYAMLYEFTSENTDYDVNVKIGKNGETVAEGTLNDIVRKLSGLSSRQIREVITKQLEIGLSIAKSMGTNDVELFTEEISDHRRDLVNQTKGLTIVEEMITLDEVEGLVEHKNYARKLLKILTDPKYWAVLPQGIMLNGPPGSGKTYFVKAFMFEASKSGRTGLKVDISQVYGQYVGQSEQNLEAMTETIVATQPNIINIDEIDRVMGDTESGSSSGDSGVSSRVETGIMEFLGDGKIMGDTMVFTQSNNPGLMTTAGIDRTPIRLVFMPVTETERPNLVKLKLKKLAAKIGGVEYVPNIDEVAIAISVNIGDVGGRPIESIVNTMMMQCLKDGKFVVDANRISSMLTGVNVQYGSNNERMVKDALMWANPIELVPENGIIQIIRYAEYLEVAEEKKKFQAMKEKIKKMIEILESDADLSGTLLETVDWDLGRVKDAMNLEKILEKGSPLWNKTSKKKGKLV